MSTKLYHTDIMLPPELRVRVQDLLARVSAVRWTRHAQQELIHDRYNCSEVIQGLQKISLMELGKLHSWDIIEVEANIRSVFKVVIRKEISPKFSLVVAIILDGTEAIIKTAWINLNSDKHNTLDKTKYEQA